MARVVGGQGDGGVVAIEGSQPAAGAEHPERLSEHPFGSGHVRQYPVHDHIEGRVRERQVAPVRLLERQVRDAGAELAGLGQQDRRRVHAEDLAHLRTGSQQAADRAGAAPDLQHAGVGRKGDIGQVGRDHGLLLRVAGPDLHGVATCSTAAGSTSVIIAYTSGIHTSPLYLLSPRDHRVLRYAGRSLGSLRTARNVTVGEPSGLAHSARVGP